jgi:hypothetical protein
MAYKLSGILRNLGNLPGKAFRTTFHLLDANGVPAESPDASLTVTTDDKGYWEQAISDESKRYEVREHVGEAPKRITPLESREYQNLLVRDNLIVKGEASLPVSYQPNLLTNGGFEVWQRGSGSPTPFTGNNVWTADRWQTRFNTSTLAVSRIASTIGSKGYSAQIVYTHADGGWAYLHEPLDSEQVTQLKGKSLSFSVKVKSTVAGAVSVGIVDDAGSSTSANSTGTDEETLTVTRTISASTTAIAVAINVYMAGVSCTVEANDAMLVVGSTPQPYVPLHPAEEMERCRRFYQVLGGAAYATVGAGFNYQTTRSVICLLFPSMGATPSFTFSAPNTWAVYSAGGALQVLTAITLTGSSATKSSAQIDTTVASGLVAGNGTTLTANNNAAAAINLEANP